ncbi:prenylated Rab receptor 2 isoform X1 [Iris pallida]|uniref:PRA1 family protein n=1 Tax=Iris pallida TaxID=29817 RepID=A0AAX6DMB4_IRIPA|nr:prenylated Rab receptor 2 isoform X1 [Iris pallida]
MASSSPSPHAPPILPISSTTTDSAASAAGASPAALRFFASRLTSLLRRSLSHSRPWQELLDRTAFSRPDSLSLALSRIRSNVSYFRTNYAILLTLTLAISLLSHPFSLFVILSLLGLWCSLYLFRPSDPPLVLLGRQFSERETLAGLVLVSVLTVFLTSVMSLLVSAAIVGAGIVCVHGAFRVPEDLFLDEQEPAGPGAGLLSFLGGASAGSAVRV